MQFTVRAFEIETLLDRAPEGIEVLSLDCFDTLIWRNTHAPTDVFADLEHEGGGIEPRTWAETQARKSAWTKTGAKEIGIEDVYRRMLPNPCETQVEAAVSRELAIEAKHAFAFRPTVNLIHEAKKRGLKVVIVSDMYLSEAQLRAHIAAAAGAELLDSIDQVFVSAAYGVGKRDGLFDEVLAALGGKLYDGEFCNRHAGQLSICTHAIDCSVRSLWQVVQTAVDNVLGKMAALGGNGGVIAIDARGEMVLEFNSEGMFRGQRSSAGQREVAIYRE